MNLYELTGEALYLQELFLNGDIDERVVRDTLESIGANEKIESLCYVLKNLDAFAKSCKEEENKLAEKRKAAENGISRIKDNMLAFMEASMTDKVKAGVFSVRIGSTVKTEIEDESAISAEYKIPQPDKLDTARIKADLKEGKEIPGARLSESRYVVIR